jgi:hypothetical protein
MEAYQAVDDLIKDGIEPVAEYVAAAGSDYGWVKAWQLDGCYVIQHGDGDNTYAEFANDIDDLAEWLKFDGVSGLDAVVHTANVRGVAFVQEAEEGDDGPFFILETSYFYGGSEASSLVMDDMGREPMKFASIEEARAWIDCVEDEPCWIRNDESCCPTYTVVTA